ncbi:14041_t:CDS:2, partial [Entrophospora sp. SA101]
GIQRRKYITNLPSNTIPESKFKPLDGIRVLELGQIKVEPPKTGDPLRVWRHLDIDGVSPWFRSMGRNKKSCEINLPDSSDILIENFRPGTMEKWNLGPAIAPVAAKFREIKYGSLIISACIIVSSIPPIPGYSTTILLSGFAYGFPMGFLPVYPAALIGASLSFFICRLLCLGRATKMAEKQGNFYKLSLAIEEGGFWVIFLIRLSPFPFTYSNAFFAAVQSVSFTKFFIVTAITLPKILIHIFIGSRLHNLADEMDPTSRIVNYVSLGVGILFLFVATYIIYNKMNKVVEKAAAKRFLEKGDVESAFETDNEDDGSILYVGDETVVEEDISHHYYKNELNLA